MLPLGEGVVFLAEPWLTMYQKGGATAVSHSATWRQGSDACSSLDYWEKSCFPTLSAHTAL